MSPSDTDTPFPSCWGNATTSSLTQHTQPWFLTILFSYIPLRSIPKPLVGVDRCLLSMVGDLNCSAPCTSACVIFLHQVSGQVVLVAWLCMAWNLSALKVEMTEQHLILHIQQRSLSFSVERKLFQRAIQSTVKPLLGKVCLSLERRQGWV